MSATGDLLRDAAEYISEHGWTRGKMRDDKGAVCAMGALYMTTVVGIDNIYRATLLGEAVTALGDIAGVAVIRTGPGSFGVNEVPKWNDAPERTAEEVVLTFKRAAELADS
jgi:hypothetical protein